MDFLTADAIKELNTALAGRYLIEKAIGQGGMATVYLAGDVRHGRRVAIKVLRPELSAVIGAERFVREIQTIAALQHPHILGLIDSGEVQGTAYYVMPFVEGESLRDLLAREKQLPIDDAVRIATAVAGALDYAHRHGVIHRDIKPENILLNDGSAMVADFGIALAVSTAGTRMTETGMSLGTPHYMSPEQAMGEREIGPRSDVYALGCVLYEMLIGEPPFTGPTAQSIIARVLTESPRSIAAQRKSVPPHVEAATIKALEKLPADRFGSARELAEMLSGKSAPSQSVALPASTHPSRTANRTFVVVAAAVGLALGATLIGVVTHFTRSPRPTPEWTGELLGGPEVAASARVSPDGQTVAFGAMVNGQMQVGVLKQASGDWAVLTHDRTRGMAQEIAWSRDGTKIYFTRFFEVPRGVWSISPLGGEPHLVIEDAGNPDPLPDGSLLITRINAAHRLQLFRYWPQTSRMDSLDASTELIWAGETFRSFPDGKHVVFGGRTARDTVDGLHVLDLESGLSTALTRRFDGNATRGFAFSPDGRWIVVARNAGDLLEYFAIAADGSAAERHLYNSTASTQWGPDVGPDGSLYFDESLRANEIHRFRPGGGKLVRQTRNGTNEFLPLNDGRFLATVTSTGKFHVMVFSDSGDPAPFVMTDEGTREPFALLGADNVILHIVGKNNRTTITVVSVKTGRIVKRLTGIVGSYVAGSPDGKTVYFSNESQVWRMSADGGKPERVTTGTSIAVDPAGRYLVVERITDSGVQLIHVPLDGGKEERIQLQGDLRLAPNGLMPNSIGIDGRIVVQTVVPQSWFWPAAILDPKTGRMELTASGIGYDMLGGWATDGSVVTSAIPMQSRMWRLKPNGAAKWWE